DALLEHMQANDVKSLGYIGFADSWGDLNYKHVKSLEDELGIKVTTHERITRNDTSVNSQMLKVVSTNPDAICVGASGTPAALPQIAAQLRGYEQQMYRPPGAVTRDVIRLAGKSAEGVIAATG